MDEIQYRHTATGQTLYATIRDAAGQYWNGAAFEAMQVVNWSTYAIALSETPAGGYRYVATFPAAITAGTYQIDAYQQTGGSPAIADELLATGEMAWDGSDEVTLDVIPTTAEIDSVLSASHGSGQWDDTGAGLGDVEVDHNYGGTDNLRYVADAAGVDGGIIRAYLKSEYDAGTFARRGQANTGSDGRWIAPMYLDAGTYYLLFSKPGVYSTSKVEVTVT